MKVLRRWEHDTLQEVQEEYVEIWQAHSGLRNYHPGCLASAGCMGINKHLHHQSIPVEVAQLVSRMLVGAQDLRGGDPRIPAPATVKTACVACLARGQVCSETLLHVTFECPSYGTLREQADVQRLLQKGGEVFQHRREVWTWRQLATLRRFYADIMHTRACADRKHGRWSKSLRR